MLFRVGEMKVIKYSNTISAISLVPKNSLFLDSKRRPIHIRERLTKQAVNITFILGHIQVISESEVSCCPNCFACLLEQQALLCMSYTIWHIKHSCVSRGRRHYVFWLSVRWSALCILCPILVNTIYQERLEGNLFKFGINVHLDSRKILVVKGKVTVTSRPSHFCERDILGTPGGNFITSRTNVYLDSKNWSELSGQRSLWHIFG